MGLNPVQVWPYFHYCLSTELITVKSRIVDVLYVLHNMNIVTTVALTDLQTKKIDV